MQEAFPPLLRSGLVHSSGLSWSRTNPQRGDPDSQAEAPFLPGGANTGRGISPVYEVTLPCGDTQEEMGLFPWESNLAKESGESLSFAIPRAAGPWADHRFKTCLLKGGA